MTSLPKAAKAKGIGYEMLRRLVREGKVPVVNIPGRVHPLIDLADLDACADKWKSGSIGGSKEETEPTKTVENVALSNQSQTSETVCTEGAKFQWMKRFV